MKKQDGICDTRKRKINRKKTQNTTIEESVQSLDLLLVITKRSVNNTDTTIEDKVQINKLSIEDKYNPLQS